MTFYRLRGISVVVSTEWKFLTISLGFLKNLEKLFYSRDMVCLFNLPYFQFARSSSLRSAFLGIGGLAESWKLSISISTYRHNCKFIYA